MKKIKRLELRTGQVLNPLQQSFVVGGLDWQGNCTCQVVNVDTHRETATETVDDPDWVGVLLGTGQAFGGGFEIGAGLSSLVPTGFLTGLAVGKGVLDVAQGISSAYNAYNQTLTIHWKRTMKLIDEAGKHKQISRHSSICCH